MKYYGWVDGCIITLFKDIVWNHKHNKSRESASKIEREIRTSLNSVSTSIKFKGTWESSWGYWASVNISKYVPTYLQVYFSVHRNWPGKGTFISYYRNRRARKNETRGLISEQRHLKKWSKSYDIWGATQFGNPTGYGEPNLIWLMLFVFFLMGLGNTYSF